MPRPENILAFDMSTEISTVAIRQGEQVVQVELEGPKPSRQILDVANDLLADAGVTLASIDAVAFGRGPGAFTGLRVAAGIAQGLALGLDVPVHPVSSLAALAWNAYQRCDSTHVLAVLDARMNEIYWAGFEVAPSGRMAIRAEEQLTPPGNFRPPAGEESGDGTGDWPDDWSGEWLGAGPGWQAYEELQVLASEYAVRIHPEIIRPDAAAVSWLAHTTAAVPAEQAVPVYLRDQVAWKKSS